MGISIGAGIGAVIGLTIGNYLYQSLNAKDWGVALERSLCQNFAVVLTVGCICITYAIKGLVQ